MEELFSELVKVWPKDSAWEIEDSRASEGYLDFWRHDEDNPAAANMDAQWDDIDNAAARNIIEDELIRLGWHPCAWFTEGNEWGSAVDRQQGNGYPDFSAYSQTRTEALLRVAIQAFSTGTEGDNKG